jgi:hypothetical protein
VPTKAGAAATRDAAGAVRQVEQEWADHVGSEHLAQLRTALVSLREITDPYREDLALSPHRDRSERDRGDGVTAS